MAETPRRNTAARLFAGLGLMQHAMGAVGLQRMTGSAIGEIAGGVALPLFALAAYLTDFRAAVALMDRPERRSGLDGL